MGPVLNWNDTVRHRITFIKWTHLVPDSRSDPYRIYQVQCKHKAYPYQFGTSSKRTRSSVNAALKNDIVIMASLSFRRIVCTANVNIWKRCNNKHKLFKLSSHANNRFPLVFTVFNCFKWKRNVVRTLINFSCAKSPIGCSDLITCMQCDAWWKTPSVFSSGILFAAKARSRH